jgi:hypothetical protein
VVLQDLTTVCGAKAASKAGEPDAGLKSTRVDKGHDSNSEEVPNEARSKSDSVTDGGGVYARKLPV